MKTVQILLDIWPIIGGTIFWAVSIERRLANIQTDIRWIKKRLEELP